VKCSALQRRLLTLDHLDQPPPDAREHLGGCSACRDWLQRLLQTERQVAELPVPPSCEKEVFLALFLAAGAAFPRLQTTVPRSEPVRPTLLRFPSFGSGGPREKALLKVAVAVGLTAALLLVTIGIWAWQRGGPSPVTRQPAVAETLTPLEHRLQEEPRWARARTADERVRVLSALAVEVQGKARSFAQDNATADIEREVRLYRAIVERMTTTEASSVAPKERERVLRPIAEQLVRAESEAGRLAVDHPGAADSFHEIATIARAGERQLRALLKQTA
jgi:hypothetical protein